MYVPFHGDGIISQFEGYEELEELDWDAYRAKHDNIQRLDRILRAEGDDPDRYKLAKQADTVLLFFLFSPDEIERLFARLGYDWGPDSARRNIDYYDARTSHGSTLSYIAHAGVLAADRPRALVGALPRRAGERRRRRPGRHDEGGHPPRRHGRHDRPRPARLHRRRDPRRRPVLRADAHRQAQRAVVSDAGARDADPRHARRRRADGRHHRRLQPRDQGRHRRRRARARGRRALHVRARRPAETVGQGSDTAGGT